MSGPVRLVVTGGRVGGRAAEVHVRGELIAAVTFGPPQAGSRERRAQVVDVEGATLLPGLHDHHVHLRACVAAAGSVQAGPPAVEDAAGMADALAAAPAGPGGWVRAVGYHQSVAGNLDRVSLDQLLASRPVRVQHRSGALWVLNSSGLRAIGLLDLDYENADNELAGVGGIPAGVERDAAGHPTGRLWRLDGWLRERLPDPAPGGDAGLSALSSAAATRGVTGWTDATPDRDDLEIEALIDAAARGVIGQRLHLMAPLATALNADPAASGSIGPVKVLLDDDRLPAIDDLAASISAAHRKRRRVAVHCVTRVQAVVALAAFEEAGALDGDRIEHGAVLAADQLAQLRRTGLTVVTQPGFVAARGDRYLLDVDRADRADLWRLGSLLTAGVRVAASSDAPLGPWDPWDGVEAATSRRSASGALLGPTEAIGWKAAVGLWSGHAASPWKPRRVAAGQPSDLCAVMPAAGGGPPQVVMTVARGVVLHRAGS
ncbi:amidohydrolase family protein [Acidiferrimicrobium sp. IK]|uniref:amidohydrolase family protein n=1 Tax=Acidiferrimicrobium sp. IK TaxID=2871700 RepID=UPI0021CB0BAB|nr:amidohydrolase family protein [Acidiferrimicrobium sp. IK]MCU4185308.1 amidohydrolase family protein [Acidiferrimicrobium sp. IK]